MSGAYPVPAARTTSSLVVIRNNARALTRRLGHDVIRHVTPALRVSAAAAAGLAVEYVARALVTQGARSVLHAIRRPTAISRTVVTEYVVVERGRPAWRDQSGSR